ncbi:MAG: hypothetical protein J6C31_08440, partial [Prevotella sp.]|nr:hypothetical protein [Prevotella sp.]
MGLGGRFNGTWGKNSMDTVLHWYRLTLKKRHKKRNIMSKFHRKNYSESFKLEVLRDYYASGLSK